MESARSIPKFSKISDREFPFHLILLREFPEFSVEWFAFPKYNNFQIFWKLSKKIYVPFASISKVPEFLVEWKAPRDFFSRLCALLQLFLEFSVEWFTFRKNNNFQIFRKLYKEMSVPLFRKNFWLNGKRPVTFSRDFAARACEPKVSILPG
jgi:hypothetical protein